MQNKRRPCVDPFCISTEGNFIPASWHTKLLDGRSFTGVSLGALISEHVTVALSLCASNSFEAVFNRGPIQRRG